MSTDLLILGTIKEFIIFENFFQFSADIKVIYGILTPWSEYRYGNTSVVSIHCIHGSGRILYFLNNGLQDSLGEALSMQRITLFAHCTLGLCVELLQNIKAYCNRNWTSP